MSIYVHFWGIPQRDDDYENEPQMELGDSQSREKLWYPATILKQRKPLMRHLDVHVHHCIWRKNYCATLYSINHRSLLWTIVSFLYYFNSFHLVSFISCACLLIFRPVSLISQLLFWSISSRWTASTGARCLKALISGPHLKIAITISWFGERCAELCNYPSTD